MPPSVSPVADVVGGLVGEHRLDSGDRQQDTNGHMRVATHPSVRTISGSLGGAIEACCLQPIDSIKTRIQLDTSRQYTGIVSCGKTIVRDEGVRALWKGLTPYSTHLVLKHTMRMGSNAVLLGMLRDSKTGSLSYASRLGAGFGAGIAEALLIVAPCEVCLKCKEVNQYTLKFSSLFLIHFLRSLQVVKIRLQQQRGLSSSQLIKYKGPVNCAFTIVHEEGVLGLWAGVAPTLIRNGINQAVMFTAKSTFDRFLWGKYEDDASSIQPWQSLLSGFLSGILGPICSCPFDVVKTRLMGQSRHLSESGIVKYKGMLHALTSIYKCEGLPVLWKGLLPRLLKIPPGQAIMWTISDQVVRFYETKSACV
ncbi:hypothetical protein L7F22_061820 [Adiantum nelumboides]|nr:hypothetical protein [Adiantum nelumboides]